MFPYNRKAADFSGFFLDMLLRKVGAMKDETFLDFDEDVFLGMIDAAASDALQELWRTQKVKAGSLIFAAEDMAKGVGFVLSGGARALVFTADGKPITFVEFSPGDCFGEFGAVDGNVRSASVVATRDSEIAKVTSEQFRSLILYQPQFAFSVVRLLVGKLRGISQRLEEVSALRIDQRVRLELVRLARKHMTGPDAAEVLAPPTQADLASKVLANREGVAAEMGKLRAAGLILRRGRALVVPSISKLEASVVRPDPDGGRRAARGE